MALIKCPECSREISDRAESCPHCGFPIREVTEKLKKIEEENQRRQMSLKRMEKCIRYPGIYSKEKKYAFCPVCGSVELYYKPLYTCTTCGRSTMVNTNILHEDACNVWGEESARYEGIRKMFYYDNPLRDRKAEELRKAEEEKCRNIDVDKVVAQLRASKITCPVCGSQSISRIPGMGKAVKIGLFGLYGADELGKTFRCDDCGYRF